MYLVLASNVVIFQYSTKPSNAAIDIFLFFVFINMFHKSVNVVRHTER
jgi:hypothetical protein